MSKISSSELILNADGSIYHLGLKEGEIAQTVITVGDPGRVALVTRHFDKIEVKKQKREFITQTGTYKGRRLTVISTGIGTDNVDIVVNEIDALFNIDLPKGVVKQNKTSLDFIRVGTSGGLGERLPLGSIVQSRYVVGLDSLMHAYETGDDHALTKAFLDHFEGMVKLYGKPYADEGDDIIISEGWEKAITLSCPGFYGPQFRKLRAPIIPGNFLDHLSAFEYDSCTFGNIEMETSGLFGLAHLLGHRATSISAILANRTTGEFVSNPKDRVDVLIEQVLEQLVG